MTYVNIQGMRAVAALFVFFTYVLYPLVPMRTHPIVTWLDSLGRPTSFSDRTACRPKRGEGSPVKAHAISNGTIYIRTVMTAEAE